MSKQRDYFNEHNWIPAPLPEQFKLFSKENIKRTNWFNDGTIKQIELYCLLKSYYGSPNGQFMLARTTGSGSFIEWHYSLSNGDFIFDIIGSTKFTELILYQLKHDVQEVIPIEILVDDIKDCISNNYKIINEQKHKLEKWILFLNTFRRLEIMVNDNYREFKKIKIKTPEVLPIITTKEKIKRYNRQMTELIESANKSRNLGLALRITIPVMGEALINFLIFVLAKQEIKKDERQLIDLFRNPIDIRVKQLHIFCNGFKSKVDDDNQVIRDFFKLMNNRNDFLHGNINPKKNLIEELHFDKTIPLFDYERDMSVQFIKETLASVEEEMIDNDFKAINNLKEYLLDLLHDDYKPNIEALLSKLDLGCNKEDGRIGYLFPDYHIQGHFDKGK